MHNASGMQFCLTLLPQAGASNTCKA